MTKIVQIITLLGLACGCLSANADEIALQAHPPERYVVVKGDTLWDISARFLKDPWQWPALWKNNKTQIKNPQLIYPGDLIVFEHQSGKPQLRLIPVARTLEPEALVTPLSAEAIPAIQPAIIQAFLTKPVLVTAAALAAAPYIVAAQEDRQIISPGTRVYVKNLTVSTPGKWAVYRQGETVIDPESGEALGIEARYLGEAKLVRAGQPTVLEISRANEEIAVNDKLLAIEDGFSQPFVPHAPAQKISGQIVKIASGMTETGAGQVVLINRGAEHGLEAGHVLSVLHPGSRVEDPATTGKKSPETLQLPAEPLGLVMVFKAFPKLCYGLVMRSSRSVQMNDSVETP